MENEKSKSSETLMETAIYEPSPAQVQTGFEPVFAVCIKNDGYTASLEKHKIYRVLPDLEAGEDHELRVIDESGEDYLFPRDWFMLVELPETLKESLLRI